VLLKQLVESAKTSSSMLVYDPFREPDREELVREVIGLANAEVDGPRNILFGVNAGALDGAAIVGISETAMGDLKKAHRLLSTLIEPVLQLAFIYDRINGKLVGTLEIDGCDFGPYFVGMDFSESLSLGQCWVREGHKLQSVEREDLLAVKAPALAKEPPRLLEVPDIDVGFNDDPQCELLEMTVPDTSDPPFADEKPEVAKTSRLKQAIKDTVGTVTTQILRLGSLGEQPASGTSEESPSGDGNDDAGKLFTDAQNHYYYEEKALKLNLCVCSKGTEEIEDVKLELGFPRLPDFDVADRIYTSPFDKRSSPEVNGRGYPQIERRDDAIFVRSTIDKLTPNSPQQALQSALRLAVGPGMQRRKIAIHYKLRGPHDQNLGSGRLKIQFGRVSD